MTIPALILGCVIAVLMGALTHLILDGGFGRLLIFLITGLIAFWFGHMFGDIVGFKFLSIGAIRFGTAFPIAVAGLLAAAWLSDMDRSNNS